MRNFSFFLYLIAGLLGSANAGAYVIDQQQPLVDTAAGFTGIGGGSEQKLAQTFEVGMTGRLVGLRLPIAGCGRGDLLIQIVRQVEGQPTGRLLRALIVDATAVPVAYTGFTDFFFPTSIRVTNGDKLAFTVQTIGPDSRCSYATASSGNTYSRGEGFFDSRPNPPGWLDFKSTLDGFKDLAFFTLMEDRSRPGSSGNCIISDRIDPATGLPIELPISNLVPACRCFEDSGAREMRCGILHPDFFIVRQFPFPMEPGKPFEERWRFIPLTKLDAPVAIEISSGGLNKIVKHEFGRKSQKKKFETFRFKGMAPKGAIDIRGSALIKYDMKNAKSEYQRSFKVDTSIYANSIENTP